jgi:uncharacterized membrane protein YphA (DoxX/SURF4 family)
MKILLKTARAFYGIGIAAPGIQQLIYADFRPVILPSWPSWMHASAIWANIIGAALITAGIFIGLGKKERVVSLFLGGFLFVLFIAFQCPYTLFIQPNLPHHLALWTDPLKELVLSGGAFVMAASSKDKLNATRKNYLLIALEKFIPLGRIFFSITMISFGIDHFFYTNFVAALIPSWIPDHISWTYIAGIALIGSGIAIILQIRVKPVALLLSTMLFLWVILLHIPRAIADPYIANGNEITSVFEALAFSGIALGITCMRKNRNGEIDITLFKTLPQYEKNTQH